MKKIIKISIILLAAVAAFISMLYSTNVFQSTTGYSAVMQPSETCISKCKEQLNRSVDLSNGPCLSNNIAPDWVCDVAHNPRTDLDNKPENQCSEYGKSANHFVEVDPNCNFIRAI